MDNTTKKEETIKGYYVILSTGAYSDYDPEYFVGAMEITKEDLDKQGEFIGDELLDWYDSLPEKESKGWDGIRSVKYDPNEPEGCIWSGDLAEKWIERMEKWLEEKGFRKLPEGIPEINVSYSEIPSTKKRKEDYYL